LNERENWNGKKARARRDNGNAMISNNSNFTSLLILSISLACNLKLNYCGEVQQASKKFTFNLGRALKLIAK